MIRNVMTRIVVPVVFGFFFVPMLVGFLLSFGCGSTIKTIDEVNNPGDDLALSKCRSEGRDARATGAEPKEAFDAYDRCVREAGLR